jgi:hypothetical protein
MKRFVFFVLFLAATPAHAQNAIQPPRGWSVAVFGGGSAYTDFQRGTVQTVTETQSGGLEEREFARRVGAKTAGAFAAAVSYWPSDNWGVRLFAAYSPSRFETLVPEEAIPLVETSDATEPGSLAGLAITSYEAQGLVRLPTIRNKLMPYGLLGLGVVSYSAEKGQLPEEAQSEFETGSRVKPAVRLGVGVRLPMGPAGLGLNFELNDQIAASPLRADGGRRVSVTNAVSFMVGLNWTLSRR